MTVLRCVSSKSNVCEVAPFIRAASITSSLSPRPSTVASRGPENSLSAASARSTVSWREAPTAQPTQFRNERAASCRTFCGTSAYLWLTMNLASVLVTSILRFRYGLWDMGYGIWDMGGYGLKRFWVLTHNP